ncbi:hypothetical protein QE385_002644 [Sphingomonas sp. SORGH_AS 950]|nr:hypothetical protein [Sphingomonas sp. SORGH_AS_0950]
MATIGHRIDGMLQHAGRIAHPLDGGQIGGQRLDRRRMTDGDAARAGGDRGADLLDRRLGQTRPDHRATPRIGTLRQPLARRVVAQQPVDLAREPLDVAERDEHAVIVVQYLGGMDIGGGDHRLADADRIGQRPARDLGGVGIGGGVDIGGLEIFDQVVMVDKRIDEGDIVRHAARLGQRLQPVAIGFALMRDQIGMGRAQHDIEQFGMMRGDGGQRLDDRLDPLVGRQQTEGEDDLAALPAELRLERVGRDQLAVGHAVRDHRDLARIGAIDALEDVEAFVRHDDDLGATAEQPLHHPAFVGRGLFENRVQRRDDGQRGTVEQCEQMLARRAAIDAIFVLDPDSLRAARLDPAGHVDIGGTLILRDGGGHGRGIGVAAGMIVHRIDVDRQIGKAIAKGRIDVGGECREPALPGQEVSDQRQSFDHGSVRIRHIASP